MKRILIVVAAIFIASTNSSTAQELAYFRILQAAVLFSDRPGATGDPKGFLARGGIVMGYARSDDPWVQVDGPTGEADNGWVAAGLLERVTPVVDIVGFPVAGVCRGYEPSLSLAWKDGLPTVFRFEDAVPIELAALPAGGPRVFVAAGRVRLTVDYQAARLCSASPVESSIRSAATLTFVGADGDQATYGVCCHATAF